MIQALHLSAMQAENEKTPLLKKTQKMKVGATAVLAAKRFSQPKVSMLGDMAGISTDGSVDALGAGLQFQEAAEARLAPQDQIALMRQRDPEQLLQVIHSTRPEDGSWRASGATAQETAQKLQSDVNMGLTSAQAKDLLDIVGPNQLSQGKSTSFVIVWLMQMKDAMSIVILIAATINFFAVNDKLTGGLMFGFFFVSTLFNAIGEYSNADGASELGAMVAPTAIVIRDGKEMEVPATELVPGDIVMVKSGDTLPADMRVCSATDLRVEESVLTGESEEVTKSADPYFGAEPFPENMLYSSTACVAGKGVGIVTETGMQAQVGLIAERLNVGAAGLSPLQRTMNRLGGSVGLLTVVITLTITALCYFTKYQDPNKLCEEEDKSCFAWTAVAQGLILGLSAVPTTLPLMTNMLLTTAKQQITKCRAIVRKTSSIETLGCCMTICSDKTGTLTEGKMTVIKSVVPRKKESTTSFVLYPTKGADPTGAVFKEDQLGEVEKKQVDEVLQKGSSDFPLYNFGASAKPKDLDDAQMRLLLVSASLNSYATSLQRSPDGKWQTVGNLSEGALVVAAAKAGIGSPTDGLNLTDVTQIYPGDPDCEIPFSSDRKMACTVHAVGEGLFAGGLCVGAEVSHVAIVKGAPDRLLPLVECSVGGQSDGTLTIEKGFDTELNQDMLKQNTMMAEDSLRVLMLCMRTLTNSEVVTLRTLNADDRMAMVTSQMAIVGAFGILDPPRPSVKASIDKCKKAGVRVVMITGDQPSTAAAIGLSLNIINDKTQSRLCKDLYAESGELHTEDVIDKMVLTTSVWARAQPSDKVTIVASLQRMGFTSAMTGDGVNDAPALKLADIGTAMGLTGTEVAKGAADIVLMNDDFTTIVEAVQEGRRTYANIQTYVGFYFAMSMPEVLTYGTCVISGMPMPLTSIQILGMCAIAHVLPPLMLASQPLTDEAMSIPPRAPDSKLLTKPVLAWMAMPWMIMWWASWTSINVWGFYLNTGFIFTKDLVEHEKAQKALHGNSEPLVIAGPDGEPKLDPTMDSPDGLVTNLRYGAQITRSMCFLSGVMAELLLVLAFSTEKPLVASLCRNFNLSVSVLVMALLGAFAVYAPLVYAPIAEITGLVPIPPRELGICCAFIFGVHFMLELFKIGYRSDLAAIIDLRRYHAKMASKGLLSVKATQKEVKEFRLSNPHDDLETN